jgi:probable phosphoglycerate mutase
LTTIGVKQVERLADRLRHEHARQRITSVYASPLRRAVQSARLVSAVLGLDVVIEPDLRPADCGEADGRPWSEVVAAFGGVPALQPDRPIAPGAESWGQYLSRTRRALERLLVEHTGQRVLVVAHGETVSATSQLLLELPAEIQARTVFASSPASLTHWARRPLPWPLAECDSGWTLLCHNDASHLLVDRQPPFSDCSA